MTTQHHTIQKQVIELSLQRQDDAFNTQQRVVASVKDIAEKKLDTVFDSVAGDGRYIIIDKLEIDIGDVKKRRN